MQWFTRGICTLIASIGFINLAHGETCYTRDEILPLADHFQQIKTLIEDKETLCSNELDNQWAKIIETLLDLKAIELEEEKDWTTKDDLTFKSIGEGQWWEYFTARAHTFVLEGSYCNQGMVAYVHSLLPGIVHLCPPYYQDGRIGRAEVLLHEVRHFEGFGHVTCQRGASKGAAGACDKRLHDKGSYAVSMQANLTLGLRGKNFSSAERALGRASALYLAHNRFNEETDVKIRQSLYLQNSQGEVFDWSPSENSIRLIKKLETPVKIYTSAMDAILYPLDPADKAFRLTEDFSIPAQNLGMYADAYNSKSPEERALVKVHSYGSKGGFLTNTGYSSMCGQQIIEFPASQFPENINNVITLEGATIKELSSYLVGDSGRLYSLECSGSSSLQAQEMYVPRNLLRTTVINEQRYALTTEGEVFEMEKNGNQFDLTRYVNFSEDGQKWVEMATRTMPYLYDDANDLKN